MNLDERVNVRFLIDTPSFVDVGHSYYAFRDSKARKAFYTEAGDIFLGLGWTVSGRTNARLDDSYVFIHPHEISGMVRKWEVDYIADHLKHAELFAVRSVDTGTAM